MSFVRGVAACVAPWLRAMVVRGASQATVDDLDSGQPSSGGGADRGGRGATEDGGRWWWW